MGRNGTADSVEIVTAASSGGSAPEVAIALPRMRNVRALGGGRSLSAVRPIARWVALGVLLVGTMTIVIFAAAGPSTLVAGSQRWSSFPDWVSGPLHGLVGRSVLRPHVIGDGFSVVMLAMTAAYFVVLRSASSFSMRVICVFVVVVETILLLGPALQMSDLFNYLGYARLEAVHGFNPYTHVIASVPHDAVYPFTTWVNWRSPYGSLFTALTLPVGLMPLSIAYWTLKVTTVLLSFAFLSLVWRCARLLGRDPRLPVLFVAANPLYLIYAVGEFHNDFFMLVPSMAAIALLLSGRYRSAGAALALGIAVKLTAVLLLPFLLLGAGRRAATRRVLAGIMIAGLPLAAASTALFGPTLPNVAGQHRLLTGFSAPNLVGWAVGLGGGTPAVVRNMNAVVVAVVAYQVLRRRDWLSGAGWATVALLASLGWLMPWYVIWLLPLAAIASNGLLRRVALASSVFLVLTFLPVSGHFLSTLGINALSSPVGRAAHNYQWMSQYGRPDVRQGAPRRRVLTGAPVLRNWSGMRTST